MSRRKENKTTKLKSWETKYGGTQDKKRVESAMRQKLFRCGGFEMENRDEKYHKIQERPRFGVFSLSEQQQQQQQGFRLGAGEKKTKWAHIYIRTESPIKWCVGGHALICGLRRKVVRRLQSVVARGGKFILRRPAGEMRFSLSIQLFFVTLSFAPRLSTLPSLVGRNAPSSLCHEV